MGNHCPGVDEVLLLAPGPSNTHGELGAAGLAPTYP